MDNLCNVTQGMENDFVMSISGWAVIISGFMCTFLQDNKLISSLVIGP